jgi:hypothetical protein
MSVIGTWITVSHQSCIASIAMDNAFRWHCHPPARQQPVSKLVIEVLEHHIILLGIASFVSYCTGVLVLPDFEMKRRWHLLQVKTFLTITRVVNRNPVTVE